MSLPVTTEGVPTQVARPFALPRCAIWRAPVPVRWDATICGEAAS